MLIVVKLRVNESDKDENWRHKDKKRGLVLVLNLRFSISGSLCSHSPNFIIQIRNSMIDWCFSISYLFRIKICWNMTASGW